MSSVIIVKTNIPGKETINLRYSYSVEAGIFVYPQIIIIEPDSSNKKFKKIIERILEDEERHHKVLREILKILQEEGEDWNRYFYEIIQDFP